MAFSTINKSTSFQNTKLYVGDGSTQSITGVGFQPDLNWIKCRSASENHNWSDSVRGDSGLNTGYYYIMSNNTDQSSSGAGNTLVSALNADGFSIGNNDQVNANTATFVSWNWKAGTTTGITQGGAAITPSAYSFNQTAGFSIIKYSGTLTGSGSTTVPHGLGVAPKMIIFKLLSGADNWAVQNTNLTAGYYMQLNTTIAQTDATGDGALPAPTSDLFSINWKGEWGNSGSDYIAYCFADVKGYSKCGQIEGNLNADGPFVYTGFKPAFLLLKNADNSASGDEWFMEDAARSTYNPTGKKLSANLNNSETTGSWVDIDFLSNGFKIRTSDAGLNEHTMIYMAFASEPLVANVGNSIPATAR